MSVTLDELITISSSEESFLQIFQNFCSQSGQVVLPAHRTLLLACYLNPGLAPKVSGKTPEAVARAWWSKYHRSFESRISQRISQPPGTTADPIINTIIGTRLGGLTIGQLEQIKYAHRISMSAENILGLLLEEFLAQELVDYGWYCGWGDSVRHVDFCNVDGSLLQIKNRSNSENSSSARVRINQPIEMWYRVNANTGAYRWSDLNEKYQTNRFSEENFVAFVQSVLSKNPEALALDIKNPWKPLSDSSS